MTVTATLDEHERNFGLAIHGFAGTRIPHWEHWSCPDAETELTGIDHYDHPRACRQRWNELYPFASLAVPATDAPLPRPRLEGDGVDHDKHVVRWGDSVTGTFEHGEAHFKDAEDVFAFSPLAKGDFTGWPHVIMNFDYRSDEALYRCLRARCPAEWGEGSPPPGPGGRGGWFYNTLFMWPLLTFGWELFMECCLDERFARVMDEFAELNRRTFRCLARLPVHYVTCHDDIATSRGPVCSPAWMKRYIYPHYEEYFATLRAAGKRVIFMADGCVDQQIDDVFACGADGVVTEPFTDFRSLARRYPRHCLSGEGDNRVLSRNDPEEIDAMVRSMVETARHCSGYMMGVGNHIPWNTPAAAIKRYLDRCGEWGSRN